MPIRTNLWKVGDTPEMLRDARLQSEELLEDMIVKQPALLSDEWLLVGRQVHTGLGGIIDLLAIAPDGSLVVIELKRERTPREVVAQALDYASWVEKLEPDELVQIFNKFSPQNDLNEIFADKFGRALDEDEINQSHQIIIVAAELDMSTERIVAYLNDRDVAINVLCFQVFSNGNEQYLSRTWLLDPVDTQTAASTMKKGDAEPWNGEFYCSFGDDQSRSWEEAVKFGFICGGGGAWYSRTLQLLNPGDRVWVKVPGKGFVGVCIVEERALPAKDFTIETPNGAKPALEVLEKGTYHRNFADDEEKCEYFVAVKWLDTRSTDNAIQEVGMFGNQNTVCKPTTQKWRSTVNRLKQRFTNLQEE